MKSTGQKLIASLAALGGDPRGLITAALVGNHGNYVRTAEELKTSLDSFRGAIETLGMRPWIEKRWPLRSRGGKPVEP